MLPDVVSVTAVAFAYHASKVPWRSFRELFAFAGEARLAPDGIALAYGMVAAGAKAKAQLAERLEERGVHFARRASKIFH